MTTDTYYYKYNNTVFIVNMGDDIIEHCHATIREEEVYEASEWVDSVNMHTFTLLTPDEYFLECI